MRPVKTRPRFHCDYCTKVLSHAAMERHERICWKNPNRICPNCQNRGGYCCYCSQRNLDLAPLNESFEA